MGKRPTIHDIAARAGFGVGTVSRVLNDSPNVSELARARVRQAMRELDYRPNARARALSTGQTSSIAVLSSFATSPSAMERLRGVSQVLGGSDYDLVLSDIVTPEQRDRRYAMTIGGDRADGLLVISLPPTEDEVDRLLRSGLPTVLLDCDHPRLPRVVIDDVRGGMLATRHLLRLGHRRIGFLEDVTDPRFRFVSSERRRSGYAEALAGSGLPVDERYIRVGPHGRAVAHRLTDELLSLPDRPTAIVAASDTQALGVLDAARLAGVGVPEELSVVGFDDLEVAEYVGLTTVRQPLRESGELAARMLLDLIRHPGAEPAATVLELELVGRRTTAPVPA